MRRRIKINEDWRFIRSNEEQAEHEGYDDAHWNVAHIPHTWNAIDGANGYEYYQGACWHRRTFDVEPSYKGSKLFVEFNGSNSITDVYVNGQHKPSKYTGVTLKQVKVFHCF